MKKIRYLSIEEAEWFHDRILELTEENEAIWPRPILSSFLSG